MIRLFVFVLIFGIASQAFGQAPETKSRLVIGIVVDQMRNDYLSRYSELYGSGGFKKLLKKGFYSANHRYSYMPTSTAPGHASIYTGTTPAVHGIVANNWYDPVEKEKRYCVKDKSVKSVGIDKASGQMSPRNLKTSTLTDELKLFTNQKAKVIGISIKDRGSVLPAGHMADGAYWYKDKKFISSSFYMDELPQWVQDFNNLNLVDTFLANGWAPLYDKSLYAESLPDNNPYEYTYEGEKYPTLPKDLVDLAESNDPDDLLRMSPWGNSLVFEMAIEAINNEELGQDEITDFLALSFSTPDYMGHAYGPRALEVQDMYLRFDNDLSTFIEFLDKEVGKGKYTIMLTADHGAAEVAQFAMDNKLPAGYLDMKASKESLEEALLAYDSLGIEMVEEMEGDQLFFNHDKLKEAGIDSEHLSRYVAEEMSKIPGIYAAYPVDLLRLSGSMEFPNQHVIRGLHPTLSGDVVFVLDAGWMVYGGVGTTHGSPWVYDQHIPLILYGPEVQRGTIYRETNIRDIAPTLSLILGIPFPSGTTGAPIIEAIKN